MKTLQVMIVAAAAILAAGVAVADFVPVYTFQSAGSNFSSANYIDGRTEELADFDGDGFPEIYPEDGAQLTIVELSGSGFTPVVLWSYTLPEVPDFVRLYAAELTPSPGREVVAEWGTYMAGSHLLVASSSGSLIQEFPSIDFEGMADFNGDGFEELILQPIDEGPSTIWTYVAGATGVPGVGGVAGRLEQNVPNPFNPSTTIAFELPAGGPAEMIIYDLRGRLVRKKDLGELDAGPHAATWDGFDAAGQEVAAGVYRYVLRSGPWESAKSMILVR